MKPHDLCAVGVRLFGVWMLVRCVEYLAAAFAMNFVFKGEADGANSPRGLMTYAAFYLGLAVFFLLGTRQLIQWTYGTDPGVARGPSEPEPMS
jgi:hypothetical protein